MKMHDRSRALVLPAARVCGLGEKQTFYCAEKIRRGQAGQTEVSTADKERQSSFPSRVWTALLKTYDVHLEGRDALLAACNLEVHLAQRVLGPEDVG